MNRRREGEPSREALVEELRAVGLLVLDRLDPLVGRLTDVAAAAPAADTGRCTACPVCAALADLGGDREEALAHAAQHAAGLLAALRAVLDPGSPAPERPAEPGRVVQRIPVERTPSC
jgi:hypothetical protein